MKHQMIKGDKFLCIIDDLLSPDECKNLIHRCNTLEKDDNGNIPWHRPNTGGTYMRAITIDQKMADELFRRIKHLLPESYNGNKLMYLNSHFRFSRYNKGGQFPMHCDGTNYDKDRYEEFGCATTSVFTLNIFLNDDFEGGHTTFYNDDFSPRYDAEPKAGRAALFYGNQIHCGTKVLSPYKYLLRTDVMGSLS